MCTWISAASAAWHALAVETSSSRLHGSAGTSAFADSAPVGATVMSVPVTGSSCHGYGRFSADQCSRPSASICTSLCRLVTLIQTRVVRSFNADDTKFTLPRLDDASTQVFSSFLPAKIWTVPQLGHR